MMFNDDVFLQGYNGAL